MRTLFVTSNGGHFDQLCPLFPNWGEPFRVASFSTPDVLSRVDRIYPLHHPTNRNALNLARNSWLAFKILREFRPELIVSSGAAPAVPFFWLTRVFPRLRARTVYIEPVDRIFLPTLTARLIKHCTDICIVQHNTQLESWPNRFLVSASL